MGSASPSASSPLCCQWWVLLGDRSICPLKPPRAPHLRASRPGSRRLPGFRPRPGLASPLMPLSPPPPLRPRFPDPLPVSSSGTGGSGELWGGAKALRGGPAGSGSRAEVGLSGGRQGASGCSGGIWRLCSRQARGLEASERGGGAPPPGRSCSPNWPERRGPGGCNRLGRVPGLLVSEDRSPASRLALSRGLRSWGGLPELEGALPREEAPGSVVAVVTLEVGGPGWGALRTQGWGCVPEGGSRLAASSAEFKAMRVGGAESGGNSRGGRSPKPENVSPLGPPAPSADPSPSPAVGPRANRGRKEARRLLGGAEGGGRRSEGGGGSREATKSEGPSGSPGARGGPGPPGGASKGSGGGCPPPPASTPNKLWLSSGEGGGCPRLRGRGKAPSIPGKPAPLSARPCSGLGKGKASPPARGGRGQAGPAPSPSASDGL